MAQKAGKKRRFTQTGWFKLIIFTLVLALAGGVYWYFLPDAEVATTASYTAQELQVGDVTRSVSAEGSLSAGDTTTVDLPYALTKLTYLVQAGDKIQPGAAIAEIDKAEVNSALTEIQRSISSLDQQIRQYYNQYKSTGTVTAPQESRVKEIYAEADALVDNVITAYNALLLLSGDGTMYVDTYLAGTFQVGDSLSAVIDGTSYDATVLEYNSGVAKVSFSDDGPAVNASVSLQDAEGVEVGVGVAAISAPLYISYKGGTVSSVSVSVNQKVKAGATLLSLSDLPYSDSYYDAVTQRTELGETYATLWTAMSTGVLISEEGGVVASVGGASLVSLYPSGANKLSISVDEADIASIAVGQTAIVTVDAVTGTFEGTVSRVAQSATGSSGSAKYSVEIAVEENEAFLIGMSAQATIVIDSRENVVLVPLTAIMYERGQSYVYLATEGVTQTQGEPGEKVYITTGLADSSYAEVLTGLSEGDTVLILNTDDSSNWNEIFFQSGGNFSGTMVAPDGGESPQFFYSEPVGGSNGSGGDMGGRP